MSVFAKGVENDAGTGAQSAEIEQWERNIRMEARLAALWEAARAICLDCRIGFRMRRDRPDVHATPTPTDTRCPAMPIRRLIAEAEGEG